MAGIEIGRVVGLNRYPVKSMQAEPLAAAALHWSGIHGDRQYGFLKLDDHGRFPWLTGRDIAALVLHQARYADPDDPRKSPLRVTTPEGAEYDIADPALAEQLSAAAGEPVRMIQLGRGAFDAMPVSVLTGTTVDRIGAAHGQPVGAARFRANILIDSAGAETDWQGRALHFGTGTARLRLDWGIPRCAMVTIDAQTAAKDVKVLRTVAQQFGNEVGMYCAVEAPGIITIGDTVRLEA